MIEKWEIVDSPSESDPERCRVNVRGSLQDVQPLLSGLSSSAGTPWTPRLGDFKVSFYVYRAGPDVKKKLNGYFTQEPGHRDAVPAPAKPEAPKITPVVPPDPVPVPAKGAVLQSTSEEYLNSMGMLSNPPAEKPLKSWDNIFKPSPPAPPLASAPPPATAKPSPAPAPASPSAGKAEAYDKFINFAEPEPSLPAGMKLFRLGYIVPHSGMEMVEEIHRTLSAAARERRMPLSFYKSFCFPYRVLDAKLSDTIVRHILEISKWNMLDGLVLMGEKQKTSALSDRFALEDIEYFFLSAEEIHKKSWSLNLISQLISR